MARYHCRGCRQGVRWAHTTAGAPISLNPRTDARGTLVYVATPRGWRVVPARPEHVAAERWMPHRDTCPRLHPEQSS